MHGACVLHWVGKSRVWSVFINQVNINLSLAFLLKCVVNLLLQIVFAQPYLYSTVQFKPDCTCVWQLHNSTRF